MSYKILKGKELEEHLKRVKKAKAKTKKQLEARKKKNEISKEDE